MIRLGKIVSLAIVLSSAIITSVSSQELTLFQPFETENEAEVSQSQQSLTESRVMAGDPVFRLLGTMRIGDSRQIHLSHRSGEVVKVSMGPDSGDSTPISGYPGFAVIDAESQQVAITMPVNETCQVNPDRGVSCRNSSTAELALVLGGVVQTQTPVDSNEEEVVEEAPDNPFARIRAANAADNPASDPNSQRFRPRRIPPEDVPEGMRVISTPFGDRLVQE